MAKDYSLSFYNSKAWREVSALYMASKYYICERCGAPGKICHHKKWITPSNISNIDITLNMDNLECLCQECHNIEHTRQQQATYFDEAGNIKSVKPSDNIREHQEAKEQIDDVVAKAKLLLCGIK